MQYVDHPITAPIDDKLGHKGFARNFALAISKADVSDHGLVLGLAGNWGAGKTSIVEMTCYYIEKFEIAKKLGWDDDKITDEYLEKIDAGLSKISAITNDSETQNRNLFMARRQHIECQFNKLLNDKDFSTELYSYSFSKNHLKENPEIIIVRFSPWLISGRAELATSLLTELGHSVGQKFGNDLKKSLEKYIERLLYIPQLSGNVADISTGGGTLGTTGSTLGMLSKVILSKKSLGQNTLENLRKNVDNHLKRLNGKKILLIIDDVDRLLPNEALQITSIVKGLGNLKNVIYILCYEEEKFSSLISQGINNSKTRTDGRDYLKKIVQVTKHTPPIEEDKIRDLFFLELEKFLETLTELEVNSEKFLYAWLYILKYYIKTPRDIKRVLNSFTLSIKITWKFVDPVEHLILDTLQSSDPHIYHWIVSNLSLLENQLAIDRAKEELKESIAIAIEKSANKKSARAAMVFLFPNAREVLGDPLPRSMENTRFSVSNKDTRSSYFNLDSVSDSWPSTLIKTILDSDPPTHGLMVAQKFIESSRDNIKERLRQQLLEIISQDYFDRERPITQGWLDALIEHSTCFILHQDINVGMFALSNTQRLRSAVVRGLEPLEPSERAELLKNTIKVSEDISLVCDLLRTIIGDKQQGGAHSKDSYLDDMSDDVRESLMKKIHPLLENWKVFDQIRPVDIFWFWWGFVGGEEVSNFLNQAIEEEKNLNTVMNMVIHRVYSSSGNYDVVDPNSVSNIIDIDLLENAAIKARSSEILDIRQNAEFFLECLDRGKQRKK